MSAMISRGGNIRSILTIALVVLFVLVIGQQVLFMVIGGKTAKAQENLSSLQGQVAEAQAQNQELTAQLSDKTLEWRNAQGRLSFNGDGSGKVCYLTFDDGPSKSLTPKNLEILKEKGVVGTWFCLADTEEFPYLDLELCKQIEAQGSAVGIHDWAQDSSYSYYKGDVQNYFTSDFDKTKKVLEEAVGHEIKICRFAGGSPTIAYYNSEIGKALPQEIIKRGYQYFDWNVLAGDSEPSQFVNGHTPKDTIVNNVLSEAKKFAKTNSPICVLMHDNPGKDTTTEALPEIIDGLKELDYTFSTLTYDSPGFYQTSIYEES